MSDPPTHVDKLDYEQVVNSFYEPLYRFGLSLAQNQDDACELTQETFCRLLTKGSQLRDQAKVSSWLFTTLYRIFLGWKRRETRLPHHELSTVDHELPTIDPAMVNEMDADTVLHALYKLDEHYRSPLVLFYLEQHSYREIADILDIPLGTVMSRLARGKELLRERLARSARQTERKILPFGQTDRPRKEHRE